MAESGRCLGHSLAGVSGVGHLCGPGLRLADPEEHRTLRAIHATVRNELTGDPIMKRLFASLVLATVTLGAGFALAAGEHQGVTKTLAGEVVDSGCYLGHAARGEKHGASCGSKCVANGMPMGLLTADGTLYLITLNHDDADPYNKLKGMIGKNVKVTGTVMTRAGMKGIDVTQVAMAR
jgi:hypothetical protein